MPAIAGTRWAPNCLRVRAESKQSPLEILSACGQHELLRRGAGHLAAFLGATLALVGTVLAMLFAMLAALDAAGVADLGTEAADLASEVRPAAHKGGGRPADGGAIAIEPDTLDHRGHFLFVQTGIRAVVAFLGAADARLDARLKFLVSHSFVLLLQCETQTMLARCK